MSKTKKHSLYKFEGKKIFIRTVTHHYTGKVIDVTKSDLTLKNAAWIADDGKFNEFLKDPVEKVNEVEPYNNNVTIMIGAILDVTEIDELPTEVK